MMMRLAQRRQDIVALLLLLLAVLLFFFPVWGLGYYLPSGGGDLASFLFPMYRFIGRSLREGVIPLWNPHQYAGAPLIGDNQAGIFYPFNLLLFLLIPNFAYGWLQFLVGWHVLLAGVGLYVAARNWRLSPLPAAFGALSFMFSDVFVTHLGNLNLIAVAAWLPWAFVALQRAIDNRTRVWLPVCALTIAVSTLAGHGQMTFLLALLLVAYAGWRALKERRPQPLLIVAAAGGWGALLAALVLLPQLELSPLTGRGAFVYEQTINYSLPWRALIGSLSPQFYGRGAAEFWGSWPRVEAGYAGLPALVLLPWALRRPWRRDVVFYVLLLIVGLLLALGGNTPVHRWLLGWLQLPFQVPARFVLLSNFAIAMLAALGLQRLLSGDRQPRRAATMLLLLGLALMVVAAAAVDGPSEQITRAVLLFAVVAGFMLLLLWLPLSPRMPGPLLLALLAVDLLFNGMTVEIDVNDPAAAFAPSPALTFLQENGDINRIDSASGLWQPGVAQLAGLYSAGGVFNPLALADHSNYIASLGYRGSPQYDLLGIKYVVAGKQEPPSDQPSIVPVFNADPTVDIYLNTQALGRVRMLYNAVPVASQEAAFERLHSDIDLTQTLIVEQGPALSGPPAENQIGIVEYGTNRVVVEVTTERPGYLLLTDQYYPGWRATVNGQEAPIYRADYIFRAVLLDVGRSRVVFDFRPSSWRRGLAISAVAWALAAGVFFYHATTKETTDDRWL